MQLDNSIVGAISANLELSAQASQELSKRVGKYVIEIT